MVDRTRRGVLGTAGALVCAGLAGCSALSDEPDSNANGTETAADPVPQVPERAFVPADGDRREYFGGSIALEGSTAAIGASGEAEPNGPEAGAVYVFESDGDAWTERAKLTADDGDTGDTFGGTVALEDDVLVVGASGDDDPHRAYAGSAYVFERTATGWTQQAKLYADDGDAEDGFGGSIALDGDRVLIGASNDRDPNGEYAGSAYVFERAADGSWSEQAKLAPIDGSVDDLFGAEVVLDASTAVIGAPGVGDEDGKPTGAVYVFERVDDSWSQVDRFTVDREPVGLFGGSLAKRGDTIVVGASTTEAADGTIQGAAYVFERTDDSWRRSRSLVPSSQYQRIRFGGTVAMHDDLVVVGDPSGNPDTADGTGAVYLFARSSGWAQVARVELPEPPSGVDHFGETVAVSDTHLLVGAPSRATPSGSYAGVVGSFRIDELV